MSSVAESISALLDCGADGAFSFAAAAEDGARRPWPEPYQEVRSFLFFIEKSG